MVMETSGRRSTFSYNNSLNSFQFNLNETRYLSLDCYIVDICANYKPTSKYIDKTFESGIHFIIFCKQDYEFYHIMWPGSYDELRMIYGLDENIIGRELLVFSKSFSQDEIQYAKFTFKKVDESFYQDEKTDTYISGASLGGLTVDQTSQDNAYLYNEQEGTGEIWRNPHVK
jgi:hypothetical protein